MALGLPSSATLVEDGVIITGLYGSENTNPAHLYGEILAPIVEVSSKYRDVVIIMMLLWH